MRAMVWLDKGRVDAERGDAVVRVQGRFTLHKQSLGYLACKVFPCLAFRHTRDRRTCIESWLCPGVAFNLRHERLRLGSSSCLSSKSCNQASSPYFPIARAPAVHPPHDCALNAPHPTHLQPRQRHTFASCMHQQRTLIRAPVSTLGAQCTRSAPPSYPTCCSKRVPSATSLSHSRGHTGVYGRERR